jgi:hypothetical protein
MWLPGIDCQAGPGESAADQAQPVLDLLQFALDDADQAVQVSGGKAAPRNTIQNITSRGMRSMATSEFTRWIEARI